MILYLDIEETLVAKRGKVYIPRPYLQEFLEKVQELFVEVYWLTAMGDEEAVERLFKSLGVDVKGIQYRKWEDLKTEGINQTQDFLWIDDSIQYNEYQYLKEKWRFVPIHPYNGDPNDCELQSLLKKLQGEGPEFRA